MNFYNQENEIDLIAVDPIQKEAYTYELKKWGYKYEENEFKEKVDKVLEQTSEFRKITIHVDSPSLKEMKKGLTISCQTLGY